MNNYDIMAGSSVYQKEKPVPVGSGLNGREMGAIHHAAIAGFNTIIGALVEAGEDVNTFAGSESDTPLHAAAM